MKQFVVNHKTYAMGLGNPQFEEFHLPSKTIPGMTLSLKQLLERYTKGQDVTTFTPSYNDDPDIPAGIEKMDKFEQLDLARDIRAGIDDFRRKKETPKSVPAPSVPGVQIETPDA